MGGTPRKVGGVGKMNCFTQQCVSVFKAFFENSFTFYTVLELLKVAAAAAAAAVVAHKERKSLEWSMATRWNSAFFDLIISFGPIWMAQFKAFCF